ncbi:MAG: hypothetical protein ACREV1_11710 [Gammaproteobacteria bacterium]
MNLHTGAGFILTTLFVGLTAVAVQWFWAYLTFQRSTRLITGGEAMH